MKMDMSYEYEMQMREIMAADNRRRRRAEEAEKQKKKFEENKELAVKWLESFVEEKGGELTNLDMFRKDIMDYIKDCIKISEASAVICTAPTLFNKRTGRRSLARVFEKQGCTDFVKDEVISLTVTKAEVLLMRPSLASQRLVIHCDEAGEFTYEKIKGMKMDSFASLF